MERSEQIQELAGALAKARLKFKEVKKTTENPFFRTKYADLAALIEATYEALSENGLSVVQTPTGIGEDGRVRVSTTLLHSSGQWLEHTITVPLAKIDVQGIGSATTYSKRYSYQSILNIAGDPDDDGNAASQKFENKGDGTFAKSDPKPPVEQPKRGRPSKKAEASDYQPWAGLAGKPEELKPKIDGQGYAINPAVLPANISRVEPNIHGVVISDSEIEFPGDPEPKPEIQKADRLATDDERKAFMGRLIKLKDRGFTGIREYLLKESGQTITNEIPFARMQELVARLEVAESEGKLKELLEAR